MFKSGIIYHPCPYTYNKSYYDAKFGDRRGYYGKTKSIDNQIEGLNEQINKVQSKLDILLKQREVLLSKNRKEEISELLLYYCLNVHSFGNLSSRIPLNTGWRNPSFSEGMYSTIHIIGSIQMAFLLPFNIS